MTRDQMRINHAISVSNKFYKAMDIISKYKHVFTVLDWIELKAISKTMQNRDFKKDNI